MIQKIKAGLFGLLLGMSLSVVAGVDLNQASAEQLAQELHGIGLVKAREIVRYREQNGPFQSVDQLVAVKGIGTVLLERNKAMLEVSTPAESTKN